MVTPLANLILRLNRWVYKVSYIQFMPSLHHHSVIILGYWWLSCLHWEFSLNVTHFHIEDWYDNATCRYIVTWSMLTAWLSHWQFGADFTNSVMTRNWIKWSAGEWSTSVRITLPALSLCCLWYGVRLIRGPYNLNLMSRQVDSTTACTGLWRDPSNYNGYPFVVQC